jgi:hypothetical protein
MTFIDPSDRPGTLIGPANGARTIFRARQHFPRGFFVGLHYHHGDESFEVRSGHVRFVADGDQRVCGPGAIVFVPAPRASRLRRRDRRVIDVFSQQRMGICVVVLEPDGTERVEEVFMAGFPSSNDPPDGQPYTSREHIRVLYATTRHLLGAT